MIHNAPRLALRLPVRHVRERAAVEQFVAQTGEGTLPHTRSATDAPDQCRPAAPREPGRQVRVRNSGPLSLFQYVRNRMTAQQSAQNALDTGRRKGRRHFHRQTRAGEVVVKGQNTQSAPDWVAAQNPIGFANAPTQMRAGERLEAFW